MRRTVSILSAGIRFRAMRAKRASSLSCRANFAESLMPNYTSSFIVEVTNPCASAARDKTSIPLSFA
jgi:hypothetical protein